MTWVKLAEQLFDANHIRTRGQSLTIKYIRHWLHNVDRSNAVVPIILKFHHAKNVIEHAFMMDDQKVHLCVVKLYLNYLQEFNIPVKNVLKDDIPRLTGEDLLRIRMAIQRYEEKQYRENNLTSPISLLSEYIKIFDDIDEEEESERAKLFSAKNPPYMWILISRVCM